jgi:hypothetical protein
MRKESFFALNRMVLLSIVVISAVIPLLYLPGAIQSPVQLELLPVFAPVEVQPEAIPASSLENSTFVEQSVAQKSITGNTGQSSTFSKQQLLQYLYLAGFLFTMLLLLRSLYTLFSLFRRAKSVQMDGYRLMVIEKEIAAFSFGRNVILSQKDYEEHHQTLLAHEQAHIRLHHFFDLLVLETVRIFHWFNPAIYCLIKDLKEIHEFQADDYTLIHGIDATQYQLLIIQKGVGAERFALANSFNHCQIKKRITMMNKSKSNKAGSWRVATFLPLLALLLMAFGRKAESGTPGGLGLSSVGQILSPDSTRQWSEADFLSPDGFNALKKQRKTPQWIEADWSNFTMHGKAVTAEKSRFSGEFFWVVQIDSKSRISISHHHWDYTLTWKQFQDSIRSRFDYDFANGRTKPNFRATLINGVPTMAPGCLFQIVSDKSTSLIDYQRFLNTIGNTVLEIRGKYSKEFYKMDYSRLSLEQREQMDIMIPLVAMFYKSPQLRLEPVILKDSLYAGSRTPEGKANLKALDSIQNKLYVVDGIIIDQKRAKYFMEVGVESITVLNGKDATDKYGEKAKNGVVEIFLKKGDIKESSNKAKEHFELVYADKFVKNNKNPSIMYFYHAQVKLNEGMLNADYIEVNMDSSLIYATGRPDSTGTIIGKPVLILGNQDITANEIRYNYKTSKGIIYNVGESKEF